MNNNCTIYKTADFLGKRRTLLIILEIYKGKNKKKRYSELKKDLIGITPKMLSLRLKELEKNSLIKKFVDNSKYPIKCEYALTKSGLEFIPIIQDIKKWALKHKLNNQLCTDTDCKHCKL